MNRGCSSFILHRSAFRFSSVLEENDE